MNGDEDTIHAIFELAQRTQLYYDEESRVADVVDDVNSAKYIIENGWGKVNRFDFYKKTDAFKNAREIAEIERSGTYGGIRDIRVASPLVRRAIGEGRCMIGESFLLVDILPETIPSKTFFHKLWDEIKGLISERDLGNRFLGEDLEQG